MFETMNDRGLNLTSTEMLKGYLLSKVDSDEKKIELNELWKKRISQLREITKEEDLEFVGHRPSLFQPLALPPVHGITNRPRQMPSGARFAHCSARV